MKNKWIKAQIMENKTETWHEGTDKYGYIQVHVSENENIVFRKTELNFL